MVDLQDHAIRQHCKALRMPTIGGQFARLAEAATREGQSRVGYLEALLAAEMEERESRAIARLLHEARLPRIKTLDAFEFTAPAWRPPSCARCRGRLHRNCCERTT
jgi:DNA replication protein DnaC